MSPLPGPQTIRSFFGRRGSSDTQASDEDQLSVEQMNTIEEELADFDPDTNISPSRSTDGFGNDGQYQNDIVVAPSASDVGEAFDQHSSASFITQDRRGLRHSLGFLARTSRQTIRSLLGRRKSSDIPTLDEDQLPVERINTIEEALADFDSERIETISPPGLGLTDEFEHDDQHRNAIVAASSASELYVGEAFDQRPSVAYITEKLVGLVKDRVDQFGGGNLSIVESSGVSSTLSNVSETSKTS